MGHVINVTYMNHSKSFTTYFKPSLFNLMVRSSRTSSCDPKITSSAMIRFVYLLGTMKHKKPLPIFRILCVKLPHDTFSNPYIPRDFSYTKTQTLIIPCLRSCHRGRVTKDQDCVHNHLELNTIGLNTKWV